ncbi:hypothetical protein N9055_01275 [Akkermansiaceae bacterium]|nr:hypothetical protein [Akkermansiaceae bacterium]
MKRALIFLLSLVGVIFAKESDQRVLGKSVEGSYAGKVVVIEVGEDDLINGQSFKFWERTLDRIEEEKAKAVIFHLDTPGGLAFATHELMSKIAKLSMPTISYIDPMAMSAGAMIAVSTDRIYMAPGSTVGSAAVVSGSGAEIGDHMRAKIESFFDAHVRWIAEEKGHRKEVVQAMMVFSDEDRQIGQQVVKAGGLLALNSKDAVEILDDGPLFAVAEMDSLDEVLEAENLSKGDIVSATPTSFEKFAWWVASISGILILIGFVGGYFEIQTPGFGVGGIISLLAFAVLFFGNSLAGNMAGYELTALFALGIILIGIEIFLIPGFGVAGISGLGCILGALVFSMVDGVAWEQREWQAAGEGNLIEILSGPAKHLAFGIFTSLIALWAMMRFLPQAPFLQKYLLPASSAPGTGITDEEETGPRIGMTGVATTDCRPAGKVEVDGEILDVVADGEFLLKGGAVRIIKEDGMGIVVKGA